MKIIKRNGSEVLFDITKIIMAISKANDTVDETARLTNLQIHRIAESVVLACEKLGRWRLSGLTLYVTIEPCPMCAGAIVMSRVDRVVYGSTDAKAGACESLFNIPGHPALNHAPEMTAGVLQEECSAIMKRFFRERREKRKRDREAANEHI